jgi:hypothetical protein
MLCIGCGKEVPTALNAPRCHCGSVVYYDAAVGGFFMPPEMVIARLMRIALPAHIESIVGTSRHKSDLKTQLIQTLENQGYTWAKNCPQCKGKHTRRPKLKKADGVAAVEEWERMLKGERHG